VPFRSRSARFAALALAVTTPLVASSALPAYAAGESTTAVLTSPAVSGTTFTWDYTFSAGEGHALSNLAMAFCSADILADVASAGPDYVIVTSGDVPGGHTGFGPGIKFAVTAPTGTITVTFKSEHTVADDAVQIQSHSGDGQNPDETKSTDGPGCATDNGGGGGGGGGGGAGGGGGGIDPTDNSDTDPQTNNPAPSTEVLGVTIENASTPAPAPATSPVVDSNTLSAGGGLPRTGAGQTQFLVTLALSLLAAGVALRAAFGRRIRSASSPG
jgi:hypothetical protein